MPLRRRISLVAATSVAFAVAIAVLISYFAVRDQMLSQIDGALQTDAAQIQADPYNALHNGFPQLPARTGDPIPYWQVVSESNQLVLRNGGMKLPDTYGAASVATGERAAYFTNTTISGATLREYVFPLRGYVYAGQQLAVQLAQTLAPVDNVLATLKWILAIVFLAVVALAAGLARIATRRVLAPLGRVTETAQLIGETDDLTQRIDVQRDDEIGRLADRFNAMLERLESSRAELDASVGAQRQLVADASHELRTPITSLRTNIEVLRSGAVLDDDDRERLLTDVIEQTEELSALVNDLIEVGRGDAPPAAVEPVRLDSLVEEALDRARRNAPDVEFQERLTEVSLDADPERLLRAINNLLDNAALHAGHGGPVEVTVDGSGVIIRDHGDGIPEADLPHIFDRFYRGASSRARQGTGLGLAIVKQAAAQHGGSVSAANAADGGAVFTLSLPTESAAGDDAEPPASRAGDDAKPPAPLTDDDAEPPASPAEGDAEPSVSGSVEQRAR